MQRSVVTIAALAAVSTLFISSATFGAAQRAAAPMSAGAHSGGSWHGGPRHDGKSWHAGHVWHPRVGRPVAIVGGWGSYNDPFYYAAPDYFSGAIKGLELKHCTA